MPMTEQLSDIRCPDCGKLLFKALGPFDVEIMCNGVACKTESKAGSGNRIKRLTYPTPATKRQITTKDCCDIILDKTRENGVLENLIKF